MLVFLVFVCVRSLLLVVLVFPGLVVVQELSPFILLKDVAVSEAGRGVVAHHPPARMDTTVALSAKGKN